MSDRLYDSALVTDAAEPTEGPPETRRPVIECAVCGRALDRQLPRRGPRPTQHYACNRFVSHLAAAVKAIGDPALARSLLFAYANGHKDLRKVVKWRRDRDGRGRFVATNEVSR